MSLALIGQGASYEFRWRRWALLRDTLAMHVDKPFPRFAEIGTALASSCKLPADELASEIVAIRSAISHMPIAKLAIGEQTAAVLYPRSPVSARLLTETELSEVAPVGYSKDLGDYFSSMLDSIANVCAHPAADGTVEVLDG